MTRTQQITKLQLTLPILQESIIISSLPVFGANLYQYKTNVQKTFQENMQNKFEP